MENNRSFWQFSNNLHIQTGTLADLSLNDSIWSTNYTAKRNAEEHRNFDFRNAGDAVFGGDLKSDFNRGFSNDMWKAPINDAYSGCGGSLNYSGLNGGFNKGVYTTSSLNFNSYNKGKGFANNIVVNGKLNRGKNEEEPVGKNGKKNRGNKESKKDVNGEKMDKRFKTLPPAEALPRNENIGGYIFVCNNDTMVENLKRQLFGLPPRYRDSVWSIPDTELL